MVVTSWIIVSSRLMVGGLTINADKIIELNIIIIRENANQSL